MTTNAIHVTILRELLKLTLLTEHELAKAICSKHNLKSVDVQAQIGKLLVELRQMGLIWAGQLTNNSNSAMWGATLSKEGRQWLKDHANNERW